jgi:hypothetical protein
MKVDWTEVIRAGGVLLAAVLAVIGKFVDGWLKTKLKPQQYDTVLNLARTAVTAAEQVGRDQGLQGADKLELASNALIAGAHRVGLNLDPAEVTSFIHAALAELHALSAPVLAAPPVGTANAG